MPVDPKHSQPDIGPTPITDWEEHGHEGDVESGQPFKHVSQLVRTIAPGTFEDTLTANEDLDVNDKLGRNATEFSIINDGNGNFTVSISINGTNFGDAKTLKNTEVYALSNISVDTIRLIHSVDSSFRVVVL